MKRLFIILAVIMPLFLGSCSGNDPQIYENVLLPYSLVIHSYNANAFDGVEVGHGYLTFHSASTTAYDGVKDMQFVSVGRVSGINNITSVPNEGWQSNAIETTENNGYLIRYHITGEDSGWKYRRFYLKEYILLGGEDWYAKIQYDTKVWDPLTDK